jgi:hypothetical protein
LPVDFFLVSFQFLNIAGAIAAFASASHSDIDFFKFLGITGFIFSFTNVLLHLFNLDEHIPFWIFVEMGFTVLWSLLYIIGASLMTQWGASYGCCGCSFAAFFGFTVTLVYITDLVLLMYKKKTLMSMTDSSTNGSVPQAAWTTDPPRY